MTAALDAIRARHVPVNTAEPGFRRCLGEEMGTDGWDQTEWPCDAAQLLAALDRAEAVVVVAREAERLAYGVLGWDDSDPDQVPDAQVNLGLRRDRQAARALIAAALDARAYEDADKVADG